jgi:hypothetical protein
MKPGCTGYEIRIRNHLNAGWAEWFDGWEMQNLENGEVLLFLEQADQSALHGVLNKIRDLNLVLVSVKRLPWETEEI